MPKVKNDSKYKNLYGENQLDIAILKQYLQASLKRKYRLFVTHLQCPSKLSNKKEEAIIVRWIKECLLEENNIYKNMSRNTYTKTIK